MSFVNVQTKYINGELVASPTLVETITANLFDSSNNNPVGSTTVYLYKVGNLATISVQAFTSSALSSLSSYIYTDLIIPSEFLPVNNTVGPTNQMFGYCTFTYPLALNQGIGKIAITDYKNYALILYGSTIVGGFGTTTTVSLFSSSFSYITA